MQHAELDTEPETLQDREPKTEPDTAPDTQLNTALNAALNTAPYTAPPTRLQTESQTATTFQCPRSNTVYSLAEASQYDNMRSPFGINEILRELRPDSIVLDAGCATGHHAIIMSNICQFVYGVDKNQDHIDCAMRKTNIRANVKFVNADICNLSCFEDGQFDVILVSQVLHHLVDKGDICDESKNRSACQSAISECARLLKPKGKLILITTSLYQRQQSYHFFQFFPETAWRRLRSNWTLTETEWFSALLRTYRFRLSACHTPSDSHWNETERSPYERCLDPSWISTDGAFALLNEAEFSHYTRSIRNDSTQNDGVKLARELEAKRRSVGEASVYVYTLRDELDTII